MSKLRSRRAINKAILAATAALAAGGALGAQPASAATITWSGGTSGGGTAWLGTTNWIGGVVPSGTDIAEIGGGTGNPIGINLNTSSATNNGTSNQAVGEILFDINSPTTNRTISNSSSAASGTLTINGVGGTLISNLTSTGTLTVTNSVLTGTSFKLMNVAVTASGDINVANAGASIVIGSSISGTGISFNKTGAGSLTLTGNNTNQDVGGVSINHNAGVLTVANTSGIGVSGGIVVSNAGTVLRSGANTTSSVGGSVTLNTGTSLDVGGVGTTGTFTINGAASVTGLTAASGTSLNFDLLNTGQDSITLGSSILSLGGGTETINISGSGFAPGNYDLLTYGSATGGAFTLGTTPTIPGYSFSLVTGATSTVLQVTASSVTKTWDGNGATTPNPSNSSGTWDGSNSNWVASGSNVTWNDAGPDNAIFGTGAGAGSTTVTVSGTRSAGSITFAATSPNYTLNGGTINVQGFAGTGIQADNTSTINSAVVLGGTSQTVSAASGSTLTLAGAVSGGTLLVNDAGTVVLSNTSNSMNGVSIAAGSLQVSSNGALGASGSTIGMAGGTLDVQAGITIDHPLSVSAASTIQTNANNVTITSASSGGGGLTKVGTGTLTLSTPSPSLGGNFAVNGGTVSVNSVDSNGIGGTGPGAVTVNNGGTFEANNVHLGYNSSGGSGTAFLITLNDGGTIQGRGEAWMQGSGSFNIGNTGNMVLKAVNAGDTLLFNNSIRNAGSGGNQTVTSTISVRGGGTVHLASGGTSESTAGTQYSGNWTVDMDPTGILSLGPIQDGGFGEPLNALGYTAPTVPSTAGEGYSGSTRPITVNSGTLAFGADFRQARPTTSLAMTASSFRSPLTLAGGNIASTGQEYDSNFNPHGGPVTAAIHANVTTSDNTTSKVLLYDPALGAAGGGRSLNFVTDTGANERSGSPVADNFTWGSNSTLVVDATAVSTNAGALGFLRTAPSGTVTVGTNAKLQIQNGAVVNLGGTMDVLTDGAGHYVDVVNNSAAADALHVTAGDKNAGVISGTGSTTVDTSTSLTATAIRQNTLTVNGTATVRASGGAIASTSKLTHLALTGTSTLDLKDNKLVTADAVGTWNGSSYTDIQGMVAAGRGDGTWNGPGGIKTSIAGAADYTTLGVASGADVRGVSGTATDTWAGQTVHANDALVMYTYGGDANLDGVVNIDDYTQIDSSVSVGGVLKGWFNGDFNYDGNVDIDDYTIIDSNITIQGAPFATAGGASAGALSGVTAVPEPASIGLLGLGAMSLLARRSRRRSK